MARIDFAELADVEKVRARFWSKVKIGLPHECWPWTDAAPKGYGVFSPRFVTGRRKRSVRASRLSYFLTHGRLHPDQVVMHTCDNPTCVNPIHLRAGTDLDNMRDKVRKGRWKGGSPPGSRAGNAKLVEEQVLEIRRRCDEGERQCDIARAFNISKPVVSQIVNRKVWKHI